MKTRLITVGRFRGILLPARLLERAGISDEVDVRVEAGSVTLSTTVAVQAGWAAAAARHGTQKMLDVEAQL